MTTLVDQLDEAGLPDTRSIDPASGLPMGQVPEETERETRSSLAFVEDLIATLEDDREQDIMRLYWAVSDEVEAIDPSIRARMLGGWQRPTEADHELIRSQRPMALQRLRRQRDALKATLSTLVKPEFSAWDLVAEAHRHPEVFTWLLRQVRQRRCGAAGAPGRSIRKRTLGRALQAAVSRHSARMAS